MKDIYISVLQILNHNEGINTNEETAHQIADFVRHEVSDSFIQLLNELRESCKGGE